MLFVLAAPAWAHTGLSSSDPSADATVQGSLDEVSLTFTKPIELAGAGVEVLDAGGTAVAADVTVDDEVVTVRLARALDAGPYGVRWAVRSGDAHPVRGTFAFTVRTTGPSEPPASGAAAATPTRRDDQLRTDEVESAQALNSALASDPTRGIRWLDQGLRAVFYAVALGALGMVMFLVAVWDGSRREARWLTRLTSRMAAITAVIVVVQVVVRSARTAGGWAGAFAGMPSTVTGAYAIGMSLRLAGAILLVAGLGALRRALRASVLPIAGGAVDLGVARVLVSPTPSWSAAQRLRGAPAAVLGALLLVGSFAFVGHAAAATPRIVATAADLAHVSAGAAWAGGLLALVVTLVSRHRRRIPLQAGLIAARFSVVATAGVVLAAVAGVVLAFVRLDGVTALWASSYGLVLVAKVVAVGVVAALGAYNHFVVVPVLRRDPDHAVGHHLRRLGLVEVVLLAIVAGLTSALVGLAG